MYIRAIFAGFLLSSVSMSALAKNALQPHIIQTLQAEDTTEYQGHIRKDDNNLAYVSSGDWFSLDSGDLGIGIDTITMRYAKGDWSYANMEVRLGSLTGPLVSSGNITGTGSWDTYKKTNFLVGKLNGNQKLYFLFAGGGAIGNIDELAFSRSQKNVLQAEKAYKSHGITKQRSKISDISADDWLHFKNVRLGNGFSEVSVRYHKRDDIPTNLTFHLDDLDGPIIGSTELSRTRGGPKIITTEFDDVTGTHDIFAKFSGDGEVSMLDYVSLEEQPLSTQLKLADANVVRGMSYFDNEKFLKLDWAWYHWLRFSRTSVSYNPKVELVYARGSDLPMQVEVRKSGPNGRVLGVLDLPNTGSYDTYETASIRLQDTPEGIYNLVFRLVGNGGVNLGDINLIRIEETEPDNQPLGEVTIDNIAIDQFGYTPEMDKVAIIRDGQTGAGSMDSDYIPGNLLALVDADTNEITFTAAPTAHMNGTTDPLSGDRAWWFDFSEIETPGNYYVYDSANNARSATFEINENIYENILRAAFRTFLYQRSGFEKTAELAGENHADGASHTGPLQDAGARLFSDQRNPASSRDLNGGWYDAGDFHKYSNWTADYILGLLHAYHGNPDAWSDDWDMPNSGNGIPDILDEIRWGVEHLQRMQETSDETTTENVGAVLSVLNSDDSVSPASDNEENSFYGSVSTSATYTSAAAYAYAASTFEDIPDEGFQDLAETLNASAVSAYQWAEGNPDVRFNNTENGVGNGNSEITEDYMLEAKHRIAAIYLFGLTGKASYKTYIESNYTDSKLMTNLWASPFEVEEPTALLHYSSLGDINAAVGTNIKERFNDVMELAGNGRPALVEDPYRAFIQDYTWGSNKQKSRKGHMYTQLVSYDLGERPDQENLNAAAGYLHYIHGVNPLGKVYLSNMSAFGAERSVDEIYHRWFADGSPWDNVNDSFGPPPGFLVGGPNGFTEGSLEVDQPPMKAYVETNAYLNDEQSWQFTENSNGYQIEYLKLLSQFVK